VQRLTEELADLRRVTPEVTAEILEEFWGLLETQNFMVHGGLDYASRLLIDTFGKDARRRSAQCCAPFPGGCTGQSGQVAAHRSAAVGKLLDTEHPQTIALVLGPSRPARHRSCLTT